MLICGAISLLSLGMRLLLVRLLSCVSHLSADRSVRPKQFGIGRICSRVHSTRPAPCDRPCWTQYRAIPALTDSM